MSNTFIYYYLFVVVIDFLKTTQYLLLLLLHYSPVFTYIVICECGYGDSLSYEGEWGRLVLGLVRISHPAPPFVGGAGCETSVR